ncbi:flavodoxin family protein [Clostridium sp. D2Q-11]|uniref:Flavodoxin family protein n=1 Tax=Anaeromonas frigoriresistens TaxID=2683708 RepID=A0A942UQM3_9FIRM|nr:NAD(P)H-dependent oxidoreductase [Anaeromonas frigoriresistens]MBS4537494.1 flavodoxin family protein [Anaeromonas frigoriresistens]
MKILAIMGASKNGNTTEVINYFEKKLKQTMNCQFEYLYLSDYNIDFCTGCHNCIFDGEDKCPHFSEVQKIEDKILEVDGVILATPGYMFSVTGIMKNFLDHVAYNCHRPKYFGKKLFIIANCTKWQEESVFKPMETWAKGSGFSFVGKLYVDILPFPLKDKELDKRRNLIQKGARKFINELRRENQVNPTFGDIVTFHAFRTLSKIAPKILTADYKYYKDKGAFEKSSRWYISSNVSFIKHKGANIIEKKIEKEVSNMIDHDEMNEIEGRYKTNL